MLHMVTGTVCLPTSASGDSTNTVHPHWCRAMPCRSVCVCVCVSLSMLHMVTGTVYLPTGASSVTHQCCTPSLVPCRVCVLLLISALFNKNKEVGKNYE